MQTSKHVAFESSPHIFSLLYNVPADARMVEIQHNGLELGADLNLSSALPLTSDVTLDKLFNNLYL